MSISLATKGVISISTRAGGSYPVYIYVPVEEPTVGTEDVGLVSIYTTAFEADIRGKVTKPSISSKEIGPKIKAE